MATSMDVTLLRMILNTVDIKCIAVCENVNQPFSKGFAMSDDSQAHDVARGVAGPSGSSPGTGEACADCGIAVDRKGVRTTTSQWLLGSGTELQILHNGDVYRLTLTRSGKLILHK